jgi:hypothetical protein
MDRFNNKKLVEGLKTAQLCLNTIISLKKSKQLRMQQKTYKTYILIKDIFFAKAGDEFIETCTNSKSYIHKQTWSQLFGDAVENNPEWFKLKEEPKILVDNIVGYVTNEFGFCYKFNTSGEIHPKKHNAIKEAIQKIVNDEK